MEDVVILLIYMAFLFGFIGLAAVMVELTERITFLNKFVDWILKRMEI